MARRAFAALAVATAIVAMAMLAGRLAIRGREDAEIPTNPSPGAFLDLNGHRVHYIERGNGPPLLLLHGLGKSTVDWENSVLADLARRWRVVAIDFFGMGLSERDDALAYGWDLWSEQALGTLNALGIQQADVVGHSLGGTVGVVLASRHPDRVRRLVLVGSAQSVPGYFLAWLTPGLGEIVLGSAAHWGQQPRFSRAHHERALRAYRIRGTRSALLRYARGSLFEAVALSKAFSELELPILQLHGTHDDEVPHRAAEELNEKLPTGQLVTFVNGTHYLMFDSPECFVEELSQFLEGSETLAWPPPDRHVKRRCN